MINYVSTSRPGSSMGAKPITRPYAQSLTAAGLVIVSNFQYGKPGGTAPSDFTRGFAGGVEDARTAWQLHTAAGGGQSAPIFFSVDDDIDREPGTMLHCSGFGASIRCWECSAPASTGRQPLPVGRF